MSTTSIGPGPQRGGNETHGNVDHEGNKTFGEGAMQQPEAGYDLLGEAAPEVPAGVPGSKPKIGVRKGPQSFPDGPNVETSPWELQAARGKLPKR